MYSGILVNSLVHFISAVFLFLFLHQTMRLPSISKRYETDSYSIALLATVFWASNPVQTQAITYVVQRMASMGAMFYIMAMYFYLKARISTKNSSKVLLYLGLVLSSLLSFGCKENTITLPLSLLLYEILLIQGLSLVEWFRNNIKTSIGCIIIITIIIISYLLICQKGELTSFLRGYGIRPFSMEERLLTQPRVILFYISLLLYPVSTRLCINHDISI